MRIPNPRPDLSGKTVVVTGAAGVLCSDMCRALAACGANLVLIGRTLSKLEKLADELKADYKAAVLPLEANVLDREALVKAYEKMLSAFGPCDILINGAGGNNPKASTDGEYFRPEALETGEKTFFNLDPAGFGACFDLNIQGTVLPTQIFAKDMAKAGKGCIINISSMNAFAPLTKIPAYSAAKAGVSNLTQWLAVHFSKVGVRVNAIAPGFFLTDQNRALLTNPDGSLTPRSHKILSGTPMERFGSPDELLGALFFLCNDEYSGFVTGTVLPVDGGFAAYSGV